MSNLDLTVEALGGLSAGIVGTVIGYPLDLVKTRMQTSSVGGRSTLRVGADVVRNEGVLALYKGMAPPLLSLSVLNTTNFASYSFFRDWYGAERGWDVRNALAGMTGGPLAGTVSTVEHMIKTQMQLDNVGDRRYRGSWHCLTSLVKSDGPTVLYTGHVVNTARESAFLGTYFYTYEGVREYLHGRSRVPSSVAVPLAGGISGAWAWFVSFPLDCVKAGMQGQRIVGGGESSGARRRRLRAIDVLRNLLETKGLRGLYAGVTPSIARAFLVSGSRFSAYELAVWAMGGKHWMD